MKRPVPFLARAAYTLIEILVASTLTLLLMFAVVQIFGDISTSVNDSRSTLEISDQLRSAEVQLQRDLEGITAVARPPRRPEFQEGHFEIIEGPVGVDPNRLPHMVAANFGDTDNPSDTTVADFDDILMFTARASGRPFVGKCSITGTGTIESEVAEIAWFVRGHTLYRRVMLVCPGLDLSSQSQEGFYARNDISVRLEFGGQRRLAANSLGDLTKRECRFAHQSSDQLPFDASVWGQLGLPTLRECSSSNWRAGQMPPGFGVTSEPQIDYWTDPHPWGETVVDRDTGTLKAYIDGPRIAEDVILNNVIGFDVKVFDPVVGMYVDLGYRNVEYSSSVTPFDHYGVPASRLANRVTRTYCTWSLHYEYDGQGNDAATDGFDNNNQGGVDDVTERDTSPPYPVPLRGIQVKIRVFEPDSRQIREVTVVQDLLQK